jgi:hypothetical protein
MQHTVYIATFWIPFKKVVKYHSFHPVIARIIIIKKNQRKKGKRKRKNEQKMTH